MEKNHPSETRHDDISHPGEHSDEGITIRVEGKLKLTLPKLHEVWKKVWHIMLLLLALCFVLDNCGATGTGPNKESRQEIVKILRKIS